jgi:hypothetical protein
MKWWLNVVLCSVLALGVMGSTVQWLSNPLAIPLDPDEVVWVLDAEAFEWYVSGNWSAFQLEDHYTQMSWNEHQYRVIDQPQLGKYIFGALLTLKNVYPWQSETTEKAYLQFATVTLPTGQLHDLTNQLDPTIIESISYLRWVTTGVSLIGFLIISVMLGWYIYGVTHSKNQACISAVLVFILLTNHPDIYHYYRLAIVNSFSFVTQLLAVVVIIKGVSLVSKSNKSSSIVTGWGGLAGIVVAMAASIKLDGLFLVAGVMGWWLFMAKMLLFDTPKNGNKNQFELAEMIEKNVLNWGVGFVLAFIVSVLILEPVVLINGLPGLEALLGSRLLQQEKFLQHFAHLPLGELLLFWIGSIFKQPFIMKIALVGGLFLTFYHHLKHWPPKCSFDNNTINIPVFLVMAVIIGSLYCSRVGFDRYIIPAVVGTYLLVLTSVFSIKYD